ncbi:MAG TPA: TIR domain-containing protein, partial [Actinoplanes sp.]|nr:TIR domain-containing protein [Actinoplanes sp.]
MTFNGFISYSHAADGRLAPAIQRGLHRLAKPWHRRRALWVFRDQTGLSVTPGLWTSIQDALDKSEYFVLLASPEAARSQWVNREITHWVDTKSTDRILPVLTDGEWQWDPERGDFTEDSTAVPAALRGAFAEEPLYLDLRWARNDRQVSLRYSRFRDAIAQLAAPMHGLSKDELEGEDVRQHRRAQRLRAVAAGALMVLTAVALAAGALAVRNADRATVAAQEALRQQQEAMVQRGSAQHFAEEARRQEELVREQEGRARDAANETRRQEKLTRNQKVLARQSAAEARRQQANASRQLGRANQAAGQAAEQERLAQRSAEEARRQQANARKQEQLAERSAKEARRLQLLAKEQERLAEKAAAEARRQQANAEQQQRVAVGRRLINQAKATMDLDPKTALMLGNAALQIQSDDEARAALAGLVTSTHYAGSLDRVTDVVSRSDGVLATIGGDATVSLWNVAAPASPVRLSSLPGDWSLASMLAFSPDGRTLAVTRWLGDAELWDTTDPTNPFQLALLPGVTTSSSAAFSPNGHTLAVGDAYSSTSLWDVRHRNRPTRIASLPDVRNGLSSYADQVAFSPDGRTLVIREAEASVYDVTDLTKPVLVAILGDGDLNVPSIAFSPNQPVLAAGGQDSQVTLWDLKDPARPKQIATLFPDADVVRRQGALRDSVVSVAFSSDGRTLAAGYELNSTVLWHVAVPKNAVLLDKLPGSGSARRALAFSPDNRTLVTARWAETATLWNVATPGSPKNLADLTDHNGLSQKVAFSQDGRSLVAAGGGPTAGFWSGADSAHLMHSATVPIHGGGDLVDVAISADGRTAAGVGRDEQVMLTDITDPASAKRLATIKQEGRLTAVAISPDGHTVAVARETGVMNPIDHRVRLTLWDLANKTSPVQLATLAWKGDGIRSLAFSPDGRTLAAVELISVAMWDVTDRA